jgi:sensor c-di-GMP phosphodiesterase-like protein
MLTSLLITAFQPIVGLATDGVVGVEALTRFVAEPAATPGV